MLNIEKNVIIIGLSGYAGSGKSTAADGLIIGGAELIKFATPLKNMMRSLLLTSGVAEWDVEDYIEGSRKELPTTRLNGYSPRDAMKVLGEEFRQSMGTGFWTNLWMHAVDNYVLQYDGRNPMIVVDDVRYENESKLIRSLGGIVIRVERDGVERASDHPSENLCTFDFCLSNNGSVYSLTDHLNDIVEHHLNGAVA